MNEGICIFVRGWLVARRDQVGDVGGLWMTFVFFRDG